MTTNKVSLYVTGATYNAAHLGVTGYRPVRESTAGFGTRHHYELARADAWGLVDALAERACELADLGTYTAVDAIYRDLARILDTLYATE